MEKQNEGFRSFWACGDPRNDSSTPLELWNYPRTNLPRKFGSWYFYTHNSGLQNQPVLYRQKGLSGAPEEVLDPNKWSPDGTVAMSNFSVDEHARFLAYTVSVHGSDRQEIHIKDLDRNTNLPEVIKWCRFTSMAWVQDVGFYYSRYPSLVRWRRR